VCTVKEELTTVDTARGSNVIAFRAAGHFSSRAARKVLVLAQSSTRLGAGQSATVQLRLSAAGKKLLARSGRLAATLTVTTTTSGHSEELWVQRVVFLGPKR
jgi:hypothetical protein